MTQFSDDPAAYFAGESSWGQSLDRSQIEGLQLEAARERFAALAGAIAPLGALAQGAGVRSIERLEDLAPLLFLQGFYKSFDENLLFDGDFAGMSHWLQRLVARDLGPLAARGCRTLDHWFAEAEAVSGLVLMHSSGTTGRLSIAPRGAEEHAANRRLARATIPEFSGRAADLAGEPPFRVIWAGVADGMSGALRGAENFRHAFARSPGHFHATVPGRISADWHWLMMLAERAHRAGVPPPVASGYVTERMDEFDAARAREPAIVAELIARLADEWRGERLLFVGPPLALHDFAVKGLAKGLRGALAPDGVIVSFGGFKHHAPPSNLERTILDFTGPARAAGFYVMTELNAACFRCEEGHFHVLPVLVPFQFDEASGALLPREGVQTGRMAFFDTMARAYWGGIVTSDRTTLSWNPCACGRSTPHVVGDIGRIDDPDDGRHVRTPAPHEALEAAWSALA
ncbi:MAG: hypothetical protein KGL44_13155 [Sphingomonadales bacterium]|nr:hypothetical protein [Sphingomonadales bacterium]